MATLKSYALTTASRLATYLRLTYSDLNSTQQDLLTDICNQVTEFIENYCGRRFKLSTYTEEIYDGDNSGILALKNYPVTSLTSIELRTSTLNEDDWDSVDSERYHLDTDSGVVRMMGAGTLLKGRANYRVTYIGGYDFDNTTTFLSDTRAGDVEFVAWKLGATIWNERGSSSGVESEKLGDYSITFRQSVFEDEAVKEILDKYAIIGLGAGFSPLSVY